MLFIEDIKRLDIVGVVVGVQSLNVLIFDDVDDGFIVLDLTLEKLMPNITYLKYKQILKLIHTNEETDYEYYGNSTEWKVEYIILSELENFLNNL